MRRMLVVVALLLTGACGGDDDDGESLDEQCADLGEQLIEIFDEAEPGDQGAIDEMIAVGEQMDDLGCPRDSQPPSGG